MQLFKISDGPWEKLFNGSFQEHEVELYSNPDKILLIVIYEKNLGEVQGAIVELYKVFHATGEVESFTETLPREAIILTKHDEKQTLKFLLLGSKPSYVKWIEDDFTKEVDALVKRLQTSSTMIKDVSKAYELTLKEISESSEEAQIAFFAEPMLIPVIGTSSHAHMEPQVQEIRALSRGQIMLGITRDRKRIEEPLILFNRTIITDGEQRDRNRVLQVIGESALLANVPVIFIDFEKKFSGMGEANKNASEIQKYEVNIDPLGFPAKVFRVRESIRIDLNMVSPQGITELFSIGEKDFPRILSVALTKERVRTMNELIERISNMPQTEEFSDFKIRKTARILKLMDLRYPNMFGGQNDVEEMLKKGTASIARASIIELDAMDDRSRTLVLYTLLRGLAENAKQKPKEDSLKAMLLLSRSNVLTQKQKMESSSREINGIIKELPKSGIGYVISTDKMIDIDGELKNETKVRVNVISENDIAVQMEGRKDYRALVRPTLSRQIV